MKAYSVLTYIVHMIQIVRIRYGHAFIESNDKQAIICRLRVASIEKRPKRGMWTFLGERNRLDLTGELIRYGK